MVRELNVGSFVLPTGIHRLIILVIFVEVVSSHTSRRIFCSQMPQGEVFARLVVHSPVTSETAGRVAIRGGPLLRMLTRAVWKH